VQAASIHGTKVLAIADWPHMHFTSREAQLPSVETLEKQDCLREAVRQDSDARSFEYVHYKMEVRPSALLQEPRVLE
jgi:hypothetical protein